MRNNIPTAAMSYAREMRRDPTSAERVLWYALRDRRIPSIKFRRQAPVGSYIADFLCIFQKLIVECDGSQHGESSRDEVRDAWLTRRGYRALRFWNHEILRNKEGVLATIAVICGLP